MHHDAEDVLAHLGLHRLEAEVGREGAVLVDRLSSDHAERQDEIATAVEQDPRTGREVLDAGDRVPLDREAAALLPEFVDRRGRHVVPGERRVDDPDPFHAFRFRRRGGGSAARRAAPRSTLVSRS